MTEAMVAKSSFGRRIAALPAIYALKVTLVAVLSLYVAFLINLDHTYWALLTVPLIVRPDGGTMVWRAVGRLTGTLLGCASGFVIAVAFGQEAATLIPAVAIYIFIVGYLSRRQSGLDAYAYASAGLVALTITIDAGPETTTAFDLAVTRTTETVIPVLVAFAVMFVVFPRSASGEALDGLLAARTATLSAAAAILEGEDDDVAYERTVLPALTQLNTALRALAHERTRRHRMRRRTNTVAATLNRVAIRAEAVRVSLARCRPEHLGPAVVTGRQTLLQAIGGLPPANGSAASRVAAATAMARLAEALQPHIADEATVDEAALVEGALLYRLASLARGLSALMDAEAALIDPSRPALPAAPISRRYVDTLAALEGASRPTILFLVLSAVWLTSAWQDGIILALIAPAISLVLPTIVPRQLRLQAARSIAVGLFLGAVVALALMIALPRFETFEGFALVFGGTMFAIFVSAQRTQDLPLAIGMLLSISVGFQPQNDPIYSPDGMFNVVLTLLLLPPAFAASQTIIFPENVAWVKRHLARATDNLLGRALRGRTTSKVLAEEFFDVLGDFDLSYAPDDREGHHLRRRARAALLSGEVLLELAHIEAAGHLPARLTTLATPLRQAVEAAARAPAAASPVFAEIRTALAEILPGLRGDARSDALCFSAAAEFLASVTAAGWLSRRLPHAS